jgi:membrane-bound lytic murein transglycosylase B
MLVSKRLFLWLLLVTPGLYASPNIPFSEYVTGLKQDALRQGISADTVDKAFADVQFIERAVKYDRNQPEFKLTLDRYLPQAVPEWKVRQARQLYQKHHALLQKIGARYGVQPQYIVALWGIETGFGKMTGKYSLISSLSTLAYEGRREAFFKKELFAALKIIEQGHATPQTLKGSWAGAMGQVQFMPTSFLNYAVDADGDGRKDLWHSQADVFASAANYLQQHGWKADETWARRVKVPNRIPANQLGLKITRSLSQWRALGVRNLDGSPLPSGNLQASIVMPDDREGRAYLAYNNYKTLMGWNRSNYFVVAVGYLADRIVGKSS